MLIHCFKTQTLITLLLLLPVIVGPPCQPFPGGSWVKWSQDFRGCPKGRKAFPYLHWKVACVLDWSFTLTCSNRMVSQAVRDRYIPQGAS